MRTSAQQMQKDEALKEIQHKLRELESMISDQRDDLNLALDTGEGASQEFQELMNLQALHRSIKASEASLIEQGAE